MTTGLFSGGARYIVGDARKVLAAMPDHSVDLILTSPPFLALRSYLSDGDPAKAREMGSEPTPGAFLDALLDVIEECRNVLAPHGSICIELGDTYSGSGGAGGDYNDGGLHAEQPSFRQTKAAGWPLPKSLTMVPQMFAFALAYGFNPLSGRTTPRWRVRNVVRWVRPNPPVGELADKFRPATSEMVVACTNTRRYFDLDAVRTEHKDPVRLSRRVKATGRADTWGGFYEPGLNGNPVGAPPLDWWEISAQAYKGSHYATFPEALCVKPILAMCPRRVCTSCGLPSERITTVSWTDCVHSAWRTGVVLDPFAGTGTVLKVASDHSRDAIGIDLDARNADLATDRVGGHLTVERHPS